MSYKEKNIGYSREFINMPFITSTAANISYNIVVRSYQEELVKEDLYDIAYINFSISNCSRTLDFDFGINSKEEMRNSLYKLDTIIKVCKKMKEDIKIARKEILKAKKRKKEIKQD